MPESVEDLQSSGIAPALGRVPSGLFILVASDGESRQTGLLASWIQQASFDPPQVTVAVNKARYLNDWLQDGSPVSISQIPQKDPGLLKHFGRGFEPDQDAFSGVDVTMGENGLPILTGAMCALEGQIAGRLNAGDHIVYLITLTRGSGPDDSLNLLPFIHIRKNGLGY